MFFNRFYQCGLKQQKYDIKLTETCSKLDNLLFGIGHCGKGAICNKLFIRYL